MCVLTGKMAWSTGSCLLFIAVIIACLILKNTEGSKVRIRYSRYHVIQAGPIETDAQKKALRYFIKEHDGDDEVQVITDMISRNIPVDIITSPRKLDHVKEYLEVTNIPYKVIARDLQREINSLDRANRAAYRHARKKRNAMEAGGVEPPRYFMRLNKINEYLQRVVEASGGQAQIFNIGQSYEGRDTWGVLVNNGTDLPKIWIDGGIHAREWIAPATALHILHQLVFNESGALQSLVNSYRWYVLPVVNPDGYEYTFISDRLWRKSRSEYGTCGDPCRKGVGVDLNRNFDFNWGRYSNSNPCSGGFHGRAPFSEPESRNLRNFIWKNKEEMHIYFSFHSYHQLFVIPWVGQLYRVPDFPELERVANLSAIAMYKVHKEYYQVINFAEVVYPASGSSMDWAKAKAGIKYAYTIELRPKTPTPSFAVAFQIPPSEIQPTGEEMLTGVLTTASLVLEQLRENGQGAL